MHALTWITVHLGCYIFTLEVVRQISINIRRRTPPWSHVYTYVFDGMAVDVLSSVNADHDLARYGPRAVRTQGPVFSACLRW
jgi:hypothetical protein